MWNLDEKPDYNALERKKWLRQRGYDKGTHERFKIRQRVQFMTGYNDNILACATIKGINGNDLYVYCDCYWFPVQEERVIS